VLIVRRAWLVAVLLIAALAIAAVFAVPELRLALAGAAGAIVIDPGHGGVDPGAYIAGKVREKDVNLDLALRLESLLSIGPRPVSLTRRTDIALSARGRSGETRYRMDLNARLAVARRSGAGLMVSVHANYCRDPRPRGPIVFYKPGSATSLQLAKCLQQREVVFLGSESSDHDQARRCAPRFRAQVRRHVGNAVVHRHEPPFAGDVGLHGQLPVEFGDGDDPAGEGAG
jgi:N-acetylmuramoyl-L-alanine amidase